MSQEKSCPNCLSPLEPSHKYCPECGQKIDEDLTLGVLFSNTISNYFSVDARFFKSFLPLIFKPGHLPKAFVGGKRLTYLHPAQMYLFISVIFFFMFSFITRDSVEYFDKSLKDNFEQSQTIDLKHLDSAQYAKLQNTLKDNQNLTGLKDKDIEVIDSITLAAQKNQRMATGLNFNTKLIDTLISAGATNAEIKKATGVTKEDGWLKNKLTDQFLKFYRSRNGGSFLQAFYDSIPLAMFLLLPIFALLLKIFFFKTGKYAHHLVFTFYYFAFIFTVFSLDLILNTFIVEIPNWLDTILILSIFLYLFIGIRNFYQKSLVTSFFKTGFIVFFFFFPLVFLAIGLIFTAFLTY